MDTNTDSTTKLSAIDKALAAAKARAAAKANLNGEAPVKEPKAKKSELPAALKERKEKASKELTAAAKQARETERTAAKAIREADRLKRREAKVTAEVGKKGAHMKKVEKAAARLPALNDTAQEHFNELTTNFSRAQLAALALHIQHFNRVKATELAAGRSYKQGQNVRITGGDPKYIGMQGTIDSARPLRCFVNVPGFRKPVYLFTSDIEPVTDTSLQATGTEG
jgi:hypothetical protein